jgi:hypothetical protein
MTSKVLRDRRLLPALDELMAATMDKQLGLLAAALAAGFRARGSAGRRVAATIGLAVDFSTWRQLNDRGLDDSKAAELMGDLVACAAQPSRARRVATPATSRRLSP